MPFPADRWFTVAEAAHLVGVSPQALRLAIKRGSIPEDDLDHTGIARIRGARVEHLIRVYGRRDVPDDADAALDA